MTGETTNPMEAVGTISNPLMLSALRILRAGLPAGSLGLTVCVAERDRAFQSIRPEINRILHDGGGADGRLHAAADMLATFDEGGLARARAAVAAELDRALEILELARRATRRDDAPYRTLLHAAGSQIAIDEALALNEEIEAVLAALDQARRETVRLAERLAAAEMASETDVLTGVPNRRHLERALATCIAAARERDEPLSVALLDIDRFKAFNDRHGHETGDLVLRLVARTVGGALRDGDTIARYGGEEFVVVLPKAEASVAVHVADRLRRTLETRDVVNRRTGAAYGRVTASFGTATLRPGEAMEDLLRRADEALYRAKNNGRNRVEAAA